MKDIDKELDTVVRDILDWFEEAANEIKQLINQARIDEASLILTYFDDLVDDEQAIYVQDWIKDRLKELKEKGLSYERH